MSGTVKDHFFGRVVDVKRTKNTFNKLLLEYFSFLHKILPITGYKKLFLYPIRMCHKL